MHYNTQAFRAIRTIIGNNIRTLRLSRNITLEECSQKTGLDIILVHKLETGRTLPNLEMLFRLACGMDIRVGQLLKGA